MITQTLEKRSSPLTSVDNDASLLIVLPFEPKVTGKKILEEQIRQALKCAEERMFDTYHYGIARSVIKSLNSLIKLTDYTTHRKGIAYLVSSHVAKIFYLNVAVERNIAVGEALDIRSIVNSRPDYPQYLLLTFSGTNQKLFTGRRDRLTPMVTNSFYVYPSGGSITGDAFGDFITRVDAGLDTLLDAYPLPLILACTESMGAEISCRLRNYEKAAAFLPIDVENALKENPEEITGQILENWNELKHIHLLLQIREAMLTKRYFMGITDVYRAVNQKRGRLLIIEEDYRHPAISRATGEYNLHDQSMFERSMFVKDLVDIVIERMLDNGGEVEFVSQALPADYERIVLI